MDNIKYSLIGVLMGFLFNYGSPEKTIDVGKKQNNGAVVITLDDRSVAEWLKADSIFSKKYNWKVTYFVSGFHKLNDEQKIFLLQLQENGNEIGYHGTMHTSAVPYIEKFSVEKYLEDEFSQLEPMKAIGLNVSSFAYPSGSRNALTDSVLLKKFQMLRGVTNKDQVDKTQNCFYTQNNRIVCGIGMEKNYKYFSLSYLETLLTYAKKNNRTLVLYSHKPVLEADKTKHEVDYETLDFICQYVKKHNMQFLTMNQLGQ